MKKLLAGVFEKLVQKQGYDITRQIAHDFEKEAVEVIERVRPYTMTSTARIYSVYKSTEYVIKHDVPGAIVECGVWRGGSSMAAVLTMMSFGVKDRNVYLYDTFDGMTEPTEKDVSPRSGESAKELWEKHQDGDVNEWCNASIGDVRANMESTGYASDHVHLIKGKVEDTLPDQAPGEDIALLRLDTDWYESTKHELEHLFPRLVTGGVLIIDDYGAWEGARDAVDEYLAEHDVRILLNRVDPTARVGVKQESAMPHQPKR